VTHHCTWPTSLVTYDTTARCRCDTSVMLGWSSRVGGEPVRPLGDINATLIDDWQCTCAHNSPVSWSHLVCWTTTGPSSRSLCSSLSSCCSSAPHPSPRYTGNGSRGANIWLQVYMWNIERVFTSCRIIQIVQIDVVFSARHHLQAAERAICHRPSVCLSREWISQLGSCNL